MNMQGKTFTLLFIFLTSLTFIAGNALANQADEQARSKKRNHLTYDRAYPDQTDRVSNIKQLPKRKNVSSTKSHALVDIASMNPRSRQINQVPGTRKSRQ